jgi:hypothetical protein
VPLTANLSPGGSARRAIKQCQHSAANRVGQVWPRLDDVRQVWIGWGLCNAECNVIRRLAVSLVLIVVTVGVDRAVKGIPPL